MSDAYRSSNPTRQFRPKQAPFSKSQVYNGSTWTHQVSQERAEQAEPAAVSKRPTAVDKIQRVYGSQSFMAAKARRTTESFAASSEYSPKNAINTGNRAMAEQHALKHA